MSGELPPRARLAHVVRSLVTALPGQMGSLLDAPRFAEGKAILLRLATTAESAAAAMTTVEAGHLADVLLDRWRTIADPVLAPAAAIVAPEEIWLGDRPVRVEVTLATAGLDDDWEAVWEGSVIEGPPGQRAVLLAQPPEGKAHASAMVRARVRARAKGGARVLLIAEAVVRLRRPSVVASDDVRRLIVRDQSGEPAVGVEIEIGDQRVVSGEGGLVELAKLADAEAAVRVQGVVAGRVRVR